MDSDREKRTEFFPTERTSVLLERLDGEIECLIKHDYGYGLGTDKYVAKSRFIIHSDSMSYAKRRALEVFKRDF